MQKQTLFTIGEVAQAHDGSLGMAYAYIDALAKRGVDAVKFQLHIAEAESSVHEPFRIKFSYEDKTRFDYWRRMAFTIAEWEGLKRHCDEVNIEFLASPFSNLAVDWLEDIGVKQYKIGSGEVNNHLLLQKISKTNKPVILSSGMSSYDELDRAIEILTQNNTEITILQCSTAYPTSAEQYGLNQIEALRSRYKCRVGFSDHSGKVSTGIAAVALGAEVLEFHVAFSKEQFGPDSSSSLDLQQILHLIEDVKDICRANNHPVDKKNNDVYAPLKSIFEKSLAVNKDLPKGHKIRFEDLEAKKPKAQGIDASLFNQVIGKPLQKDIKSWSFLTQEYINL